MKRMSENLAAWLRGLAWTAMILGCAWAGAQTYSAQNYSAQSYLVAPPAAHYHVVTMAAGEGVGQGAADGGQNTAGNAVKDDLFAGTEGLAKNATHVTEITMDPDSLNMVGGPDAQKAHNMVLNVVRTYEYDKPGMYSMADVDAIRNRLNTGDWRCSVHVRDLKTGAGQDICSKHRTDGLREEAIIEVEPRELTLIHRIWRPSGPGSSELGFFPVLPGLDPTAMLAMTDPDAFAQMEIGLHTPPMILPQVQMQIQRLNYAGIKQQMEELSEQMKQMKLHPIDPGQMQKLNDQMKNIQKNFYKDKSSVPPPTAPTAPQPPQ